MTEFIKSEKGKCLYWIIGTIMAIITLIFCIPSLFNIFINKIEPFIFGMPYIAFMQIVFWLILAFALVALYQVQRIRGEL